jgi:hypothetical protein
MEWIMALFETSYEHEITCQRPLLWCRSKKSGGGVEGRRQEGSWKMLVEFKYLAQWF